MLSNKVSEIMTTHLITAAVTASVFEVMEKMVAEDVGRHVTELRLNLLDWAESVEGGATEEEFVEYAHAQLTDSREDAPTYDFAMPLWQSYRGLARWAEKRASA